MCWTSLNLITWQQNRNWFCSWWSCWLMSPYWGFMAGLGHWRLVNQRVNRVTVNISSSLSHVLPIVKWTQSQYSQYDNDLVCTVHILLKVSVTFQLCDNDHDCTWSMHTLSQLFNAQNHTIFNAKQKLKAQFFFVIKMVKWSFELLHKWLIAESRM